MFPCLPLDLARMFAQAFLEIGAAIGQGLDQWEGRKSFRPPWHREYVGLSSAAISR